MKKVVFFTGSGISVESGLSTYRMADGLWNDYPIDEVATSRAIKNDLGKVNRFFNKMRKIVLNAEPNEAHRAITSLEDKFDITVLTQNVDDLHERALTSKVIHLHGHILEVITTGNTKVIDTIRRDIEDDERDPVSNGRLRPNIVLFDEIPHYLKDASRIMEEADAIVVVGSTLQVYPVNMLVLACSGRKDIYVIDPNPNYIEDNMLHFLQVKKHIQKPAVEGMKEIEHLLK